MNGLFDINGSWRPEGYDEMDHKRVRDACREITRRTQYRAWFNAMRMQIGFGFHSTNGLEEVWSIPMFRDGRNPIRFAQDELYDVEQVVYVLQATKRSMQEKMALEARFQAEKAEEDRLRREADARAAGEAMRDRCTVHGRTSAVVSGRKGN